MHHHWNIVKRYVQIVMETLPIMHHSHWYSQKICSNCYGNSNRNASFPLEYSQKICSNCYGNATVHFDIIFKVHIHGQIFP
jgi:DnaJ-class molecular chaperone